MKERVNLGIECGGTRTTAIAAAGTERRLLKRLECGPANLRLVTDAQLEAHFVAIRDAMPVPSALGIGMAGVRTEEDRQRILGIAARVWLGVPAVVDHDLVTALEAAAMDGSDKVAVRVVVLSGTGSCCFGRNRAGTTAKMGGWGHLLGDCGSGYDIAHSALRQLIHRLDRTGSGGRFGPLVLRQLLLNDFEPLVGWIQGAGKRDVAALAPLVFQAAAEGDREMRLVVEKSLGGLFDLAVGTARKLAARSGAGRDGAAIEFVLAGSVFAKQPRWRPFISKCLKAAGSRVRIRVLERESAWGAVALAERAEASTVEVRVPGADAFFRPEATAVSPTELRNPRSKTLDRMPLKSAVELMLAEEAGVAPAVSAHSRELAALVRRTSDALRSGGRLFYVGAGTSGRLGVLDASECPPTFRSAPEQVQGVMAGGEKALHSAVEGAEDDAGAGIAAMVAREVGAKDVVVGIAASGRTPFVWGALGEARKRGAATALVSFQPHLKFARGSRPDHVLAVDVGPEVLTGSTRLKSGTATKLILNTLTTLAFVRLGKVAGNLMVDLNPSNVKLRDRAVRIACEISGESPDECKASLQAVGWNLRKALDCLGRRLGKKG
jgi:N-acetylmuramic acid 6-phosphate etherase